MRPSLPIVLTALLLPPAGSAAAPLAAQGLATADSADSADGVAYAQFADLPGFESFEQPDGVPQPVWRCAGGAAWPIVGDRGGDLVVRASIGPVLIDTWRIRDGAVIDLVALIARWTKHPANADPSGAADDVAATFAWTEGFGDTFGDERLLLEPGSRRRAFVAEPLDADDRSGELWALQVEAGRSAGRVARTGLPTVAQDAVQIVLRTLVPELAMIEPTDIGETAAPTEVLRRLLRHGWLERVAPELDAEEVIESMRDAAAFLPTARFVAGDASITRFANAFGDRATVVRDGAIQRVALPHVEPPYTGDVWTRLGSAWVELELPTDADPLGARVVEQARRGALRLWGRELADWDAGEEPRFAANWVESLGIRDDIDDAAALPDLLPPHVLLQTPLGDRVGLLVPRGLLRAPAGAADAERFLDDAARLLPDAGQLDLIGQYLIDYTFDSPDPERPLLLGTETFSGDAQNRPEETLATACGGVGRGDCDDLAALYIEIRRRQGVFAVPMGSPGHLAAVWVVERDGQQAAQVLQTMLPLEFRGATVEAALAALYRHEAPNRPFDPQWCSVPLRLAGERLPSDVGLPVGAFARREFAADVVRRLKLRHRGLLGAAADAAWQARRGYPSELEPRFAQIEARWIAAPDRAAKQAEELVALAGHPVTRARARVLAVLAHHAAGDAAAAELHLDRFLGVDLPAVVVLESELASLELVTGFAMRLDRVADDALRRRLVGGVILPRFRAMVEQLVVRWNPGEGTGSAERFPKATDDALLEAALIAGSICVWQVAVDPLAAPLKPELDAAMERYVRDAMAALEVADGLWWEELELCGSWLALDDDFDLLRPDGPLPRWPGGGIAWLLDQLDDAGDDEWRARVARWVAVAPPYWSHRTWRETAEDRPIPPATTLRALLERLTKVQRTYAMVEAHSAFNDLWCVVGRIRCAVLLDDHEQLAEDFAWLGRLGNPNAFGFAITNLVDVGVRVPPEAWRGCLERWCADSGYAVPAFGFAWEALRRGAIEHARVAADVAHVHAGEVDAEVRALGLDANWAAAERQAVLDAIETRTR